MSILGEKIKRLLKLHKVSASELAKTADVSAAYMSELINGVKDNPTLDVINKIADHLKVDPGYLVTKREALLPQDIPDFPPALMEYIVREDKRPYLDLAKYIDEQSFPPDAVKEWIESMRKMMESETGRKH